ncbi:ABC transporter substrate-binding protein [Roseixanthobacter liquoris]|uniref:ABC transporter substrate-binding protein n=1 Tax=Roseixanthobacter liquoris TaxID=3119921 RepID=UPI0037286175
MPGDNNGLDRRQLLSGGLAIGAGIVGASVFGPAFAVEPGKADSTLLRAPEPNPKRGGTFRTAFGATTAHNDIHQGGSYNILTQMYDGLVSRNLADGLQTIAPSLAKSWDISSDRTIYTFHLRGGVKFHDGTPFSSDDVAATFNRIISPPDNVVSIYKDQLSRVQKVRALDPLTVEFVLSEPWTPFLDVIAGPAMVIYSKKAIDENRSDLRKVMAPGTGPFVFDRHRVGEVWEFNRNKNYWNPELPYIDRLRMLNVPGWVDRGTAVMTDQADFSWNVSPQTWEEGTKRSDIRGTQLSCLNSHTLTLNNARKPFDNPLVRRAIHLAVSRQHMIQALSTQEPVFVSRWMPNVPPYAMPEEEILKLPGYRADKKQDIEQARDLLSDAGYPDGFGNVEMITASVTQWADINAPTFQDELKRTLKIQSRIRLVERGLLPETYKSGNFDMIQEAGYQSTFVDPTVLWTNNLRTGASSNWARYSNPKLDAIIDQVNGSSDEAARKQLFRQGMDLLDENPPFYLIGFCKHSPMWQSRVRGLAMDKRTFSEWGRLDTVWLDQ